MTERLSEQQLIAMIQEAEASLGLIGSRRVSCVHKASGTYYVLDGVMFREGDMQLMVCYHPLKESRIKFLRPLLEFNQKFSPVIKV